MEDIKIKFNAYHIYKQTLLLNLMSKFFNNQFLIIAILLIFIVINLIDINFLILNVYIYTKISIRFLLYLGVIFSSYLLVKYFTNITNKFKKLDFLIVLLSSLNFALKFNQNLFLAFGIFFNLYLIFLYFNYKNIDIVKFYVNFIKENPNFIIYNYIITLFFSLFILILPNVELFIGMLKNFTRTSVIISVSVTAHVHGDNLIDSGTSIALTSMQNKHELAMAKIESDRALELHRLDVLERVNKLNSDEKIQGQKPYWKR